VALADMPLIAPASLAALVACWRQQDRIIVPLCAGQAGHPVIFPARWGDELLVLQGDRGARALLDAHGDDVFTFLTTDSGVLRDIDTPEELALAVQPAP
jgi:molybdenum cofactor cytidylyltransferase